MCRMGHGISLRGSRGHRDAVRAREGYPEAPAAAPTGTRRLPIAIGMGCRVYCGPNHFANTSTPDVLAMWRDAVTAPVETNQHEGANRRYRLKKSASRDADLTKPRSRPAIPRIAWPARLERLRRTGTNNGMHPGRRKYPSRPPGAGPRPTYQTPSSHLTVKQRSHHHHP